VPAKSFTPWLERSARVTNCFALPAQRRSHPWPASLCAPVTLYCGVTRAPCAALPWATDGSCSAKQPLDADDTPLQSATLPGLALNKQQEAWLLYSEIPIGTWGCQQLAERPPHNAPSAMRHIRTCRRFARHPPSSAHARP